MLAIRNKLFKSSTNDRGFTLVEVTIILLVLVILSMIMLPQLGNFNRLARKVKVLEDLGAICATMKKMLDEVSVNAYWEKPGGGTAAPAGARVGLLHGPGAASRDLNDSNFHQVSTPDNPWAANGPNTGVVITAITDAPGAAASSVDFGVDRFENHLMVNDPFGISTVSTDRYNNTSENDAASFFLSWKGPYFDRFTPDPWGNRYASNVFALHTRVAAGVATEYFTSAVVCYSSGPDGSVQTRFNQPMDDADNDYGWVTGGDDFAVILSAGGPF